MIVLYSVHHNIKDNCQGFCMWPEFADCLALVSLPPTCSHLCWRQLLQVPVQSERGVFQRCVRPVPGDDWWENMTVDPSAKNLITQPGFFFFPFFYLWGGRRTFVALLDGLCERASGVGRTNKEKDRLGKKMNMWKHQQGCRLLSLTDSLRIVSGPRDTDADLTPEPNTRGKEGKLFFWMDNVLLFKMSSEEFTKGWLFLITKMILIGRLFANNEIFVN